MKRIIAAFALVVSCLFGAENDVVLIQYNASGVPLERTLTADNAITTLATFRQGFGLEIGVDVQAFDADLSTWAGITPGTGVGTALAVNVGSAGAFVTFDGALGTPSSGTGTFLTGIPISTGISGLGSNVAAWLADPTFAKLNTALTGDDAAGLAANNIFTGANTLPGFTLTGSITTQTTAMPALAVNFNLPRQTYSGNGSQTFTYSNNTAGESTTLVLTASGGTLTPTIPSTFSYAQNTNITTLGTIGSGNEMIVSLLYTGARYEIVGDPVVVTGGGTAFLQITPSSTVGQIPRVTGAGTTAYGALDLADGDAVTGLLPLANVAAIVEKIAVFSVDGGGAAIATGTVAGTARIPFACTLTGYSITATAATGTNTIKIWAKASGTAIPTIADVINTSGVSLSTGTAVASATLTDFTDTTYAAGDMMRCAITAVDGAATDLTVTLYGTRQ